MISGRNDTNLSTVLKLNRIAGTRDCVVLEFDAHELACNSFGLLLYEGILSDELFLVKLAEHSESGHNRRNLSAEFVTARQRRKGLPENCSLKASIVLAPFEAGRFVLPDIPVVVAGRDGNDTLVFEGCEMEVCTIPVDTASFVIHDIKGQVKYPYTFAEVAPWLFALVLLAALIALLLWLIERLRRRGKQDPASNDPAHIVALRELEKYRSDRYWAPDKQKAFYSGITDALKTYIDARFGIDAPEMTTAELFDALKALPSLDKDMLASLRDMFETADFVKFARHTADDDANRRALPLAVSFVTATIPVESETEEKGEEARRS